MLRAIVCSLLAWFTASITASVPACALANSRGTPPVDPILRVDTPMHTALIRRMVHASATDRLITASDDKTIRIWQLPTARLVTTLRAPLGDGHEGQLFALAVAPDGRRIAAGGWTCWDWERAGCVYVFDAESGEIVHRIRGHSDAVSALAWSPDGRYLAIGLQGRAGLRIVRTDNYAEVASDRAYADKVIDLAYAGDGTLASVALDGRLRSYRADHRLHARVTLASAQRPAAVRFSPDGKRIAVGFLDAPLVAIHDAGTLGALAVHRARDPAQRSLASIAWSADGGRLFAAGERSGVGPNRIGVFAGSAVSEYSIPARRVSELIALAGERLAFAAEDPRIGVLAADGTLTVDRPGELTDFAAPEFQLRVAHDASVIGFTAADGNERRFAAESADGVAAAERATLAPPLTAHAAWRVTIGADRMRVNLNERAVRLDDYEIVRSYALSADGSQLALGTEWSLRLFDSAANERWRTRLAAIAWSVNMAPDGRHVVAALSDGTIRWYRNRDGAEVLAYFPHAGGEEWAAWTRAGYYMSSPHGDNLVGWHLNRGLAATPEFYRAVQFERALYRPELVTNALRSAATRGVGPAGALPALTPVLDAERLRSIAPPRLRVDALGVVHDAEGYPRARLRVSATRGARALSELTVYVNEVPVLAAGERALSWRESSRLERELLVPLDAGENEVRVESATDVSMGYAETVVTHVGPAPAHRRGDLYVLAIGNNAFPRLPAASALQYAARDAEEFARALERGGRGLYRDVHTRVLADTRAIKSDRASVLAALGWLARVRAEDTLVVFLASHGVSDRAGHYWFVPRDGTAADLARLESSEADPASAQIESLIPWTRFFEALRVAAGRRVLIVDTCQARGMEGRFAPYALAKRSASSRFTLIVAAQADEESQEYPPAKHGLFTYALLQGLSARADRDGDGRISVRELFEAARPTVAELHDRALGPQTPALITSPALGGMPLALAPPAPEVSRSSLTTP